MSTSHLTRRQSNAGIVATVAAAVATPARAAGAPQELPPPQKKGGKPLMTR